MSWESRLWFFDIEVFKHDWVVCVKQLETHKELQFVNDYSGVYQFMSYYNPILCGYNNKHYDNYILKGILNGMEAEEIKDINDYIIYDGKEGWTYPFNYPAKFDSCDLMLDLPQKHSLKEIEGNLGMNIVECTVPFDIDRKLTESEMIEVVKYCKHDVDALLPLFEKRKSYLSSKVDVGNLIGLEAVKSLYMTNAQLTSDFLGAKASKLKWQDERKYEFPNEWISNYLPNEVKKFINLLKDESISPDKLFKKKLSFEIADCPHTFGFGGLHGALPKYHEIANQDRVILNADVSSYYPSIMIIFNYISRNIENPDLFKEIYHKRIQAKKDGDKKLAEALKLILNTTYGATLNQYSNLYDPLMARSVCITGQIYLIYLITLLEDIPTLKLIQSNTDGIMFSIDKKYEEFARENIKLWENRTGFTMEIDEVRKIYQKDVNNYVMLGGIDKNGKDVIKVKGAYVSDFGGGDFKHNTMSIVCDAIVDYFLYGIPVEETIMDCDDIQKFQMIAKTGRTYQDVIWQKGK